MGLAARLAQAGLVGAAAVGLLRALPAPEGPGAPSPTALLALILILLGGSAGGAWLLLMRPLRIFRSPDAVGYLPEAGWSRAQVARRVRRNRCHGEVPPVFPNGWFRLLDSEQLARGEVRNVAALGEQFAIFRDADGKAHVVDAYCPHLGANLAVGGRVVGSCIECPFHGWQFHGEDGRCTRVPYAEKVPAFAKVRVWPSREVSGMILIWYHCDGLAPTWEVPEQEELLSREWVFRGCTEHFINAHIEEIPENAADAAHLTVLHGPSILGGADLRHTGSCCWTFSQHHWQAEWQPEPEPSAHCSRMLLNHRLTLFGWPISLMNLAVVARQVGPGLVFMTFQHHSLGRGMIIQTVTPVEPLLQHVVHRLYYQWNIPAFIPKFMLWAECTQFERDVMIWNNKKYSSRPLLVKEDAAIQRHRRWYAQFYTENSVRFTAQSQSLDW